MSRSQTSYILRVPMSKGTYIYYELEDTEFDTNCDRARGSFMMIFSRWHNLKFEEIEVWKKDDYIDRYRVLPPRQRVSKLDGIAEHMAVNEY